MSARHGLLALLALACLAPLPASGEVIREESVGVAPVGKSGVPRDDAVRAAVQAAVLRSARGMLPADFVPPEPEASPDGAPPPPMPDPESWLEQQLGKDPFAYATRFSILEDRGRRPAMFATEGDVEFEYVIVAEVTVDLGAIRERLETAGALEPGTAGAGREVLLVLEGLTHYQPVRVLREALQAERGVRSVVPIEFSDGRAVLAVDSDRDAEALVEDLRRQAPAGLRILPVQLDPAEATLLVEWSPPDAPAREDLGEARGSD